MKNYKFKDVLIPIVSLVGIFFLSIYIIISISSSLSSYNTVSQYDSNIVIYESNIAKLTSLSDTDLQNKQVAFNEEIPLAGNVSTLVNDTFNLANSFGLSAQQTSGNKQTNPSTVKAISINDLQSGDLENIPENILIKGLVYPVSLDLTVKGKKDNIITFIDQLSQQKRILKVINQTLTTADSGITWSSKLTIYAYSVKDIKVDTRTIKKIIDPTDLSLLTTPKSINISL